MKKIDKGQLGYIDLKKKQRGIVTGAGFFLVAVLFFIGFLSTGTRNNIMTVFSILTVLPVAKFAVGFFMLLPFQSLKEEEYRKIVKASGTAFVLAELMITSREKVLPTDYMVVQNGNVCGFTRKGYDTDYAARFIADNLRSNGVKASVHIFREEKQFLKRAGELSRLEPDEEQRTKDKRIADLILTLVL